MTLPLPASQDETSLVRWTADPEYPNALVRPLFGIDDLLVCWNRWGGSEPIVAGTFEPPASALESSAQFGKALRVALAATLYQVPDLAVRCTTLKEKLHLQYVPFASDEEVEGWIDKIIREEHVEQGITPEAAFEALRQRETAPGNLLSPVQGRNDAFISITWLKFKAAKGGKQELAERQVLFLRGWHVLLDGLVILEVFDRLLSNLSKALQPGLAKTLPRPSFDGSDAARLSPHALDCIPTLHERYSKHTPDQSAWATFLAANQFGYPLSDDLVGKQVKWTVPDPTSRHHMRLSARASKAFFEKVNQRGITVNTFFSAAQITAVLRLTRSELPQEGDGKPITLAQLHTSNLRPFMTGARKNTCASAAEGLIAAADSGVWDAGLRANTPLDKLEEETVWNIAEQLQAFVAKARADPLELCCQATHEFWGKFNAAGDAIAAAQMPNPKVKSLGTSLLGIAERYIDRSYGDLNLLDVNVSIRASGLVVAQHTWTFRDQFNMQCTFPSWMFARGSMVRIHQNIASLLGRISGYPDDIELVCDRDFSA